jgi:hypothetical protein|tara:strand:+ start:314 stop:544 length:231 start_codon:yes stop_codon:yes gene_type:complete
MTQLRMTYEGLAQAIADSVNEDIRFNNNLSDGDTYNDTIIEQMVMDKASEETPSYLDHYDVASKALEMVDYDAVVS